jgi:sigma-B regulation protein RsbU (phosphoserine phosphatase)
LNPRTATPRTSTPRHSGIQDFFDTYTKDLTADDVQRLFTRDTRDAYKFFTRGVQTDAFKALPRHKRLIAEGRVLFLAFAMKLSPARRLVYGIALLLALIGLINLFRGVGLARVGTILPFGISLRVPGPLFHEGTWSLLVAFALMNLLVLLEVADRLTLKNDLEIARDIQQAMLPSGVYQAAGLETVGLTRPANTVGGDLYDILPLPDGRLVITVGDVSGKGSPAALLMALLVAMLRTLADERLEPADLVRRLNAQVCRHAPGSRFITLFYAVYDPPSGQMTYVNAGHTQPLLLRANGTFERLTEGGIALGMFEHSTYRTGSMTIHPNELLAIYSDGITEAENPAGRPFDESGLESSLKTNLEKSLPEIGASVVRAVEHHTGDVRLADDLTLLLLRRTTAPVAAGV